MRINPWLGAGVLALVAGLAFEGTVAAQPSFRKEGFKKEFKKEFEKKEGREGGDSLEAEVRRLRERLAALEARLKEKGGKEGENRKDRPDADKGRDLWKKFAEGRGFKMDSERMKELMKKFSEGKGGKDREKQMELWKKFAESRKEGGRGGAWMRKREGGDKEAGGDNAEIRRALDNLQRSVEALRKTLDKK